MIIKLAGYNVDADLLENPGAVNRELFTPEIFSSAYARISRSSKDVTQLRLKAQEDVEKARQSNRNIIFGMGHHSVAEHAVFNFDIIGVSRLALEAVEQFRLASFTEKSQRYVTLKGDYRVPEELQDTESKTLFHETVKCQNAFYEKAYEALKDYIFKKHPDLAAEKENRNLLQGWAKEDARYILALATEGQVGMTVNARTLEHLFRRFKLSDRAEVREIGSLMYEQVMKIAPSLILFAEPSRFARDLASTFGRHFKDEEVLPSPGFTCHGAPKVTAATPEGDDIILASFMAVINGLDYGRCLGMIKNKKTDEKKAIYRDLFKHMEFFDAVPREFEMVDISFEAVISASNFAQLKRHRMASLLAGNYDTGYGNMIPENIKEVELEDEFMEIINRTNETYEVLKEKYGAAADYILTNSHCRNVMMKMNLREAYHFMRLRDDEHAQWDIRLLAHRLLGQIEKAFPLASMMLCGKSDFIKRFKKAFNREPEFKI